MLVIMLAREGLHAGAWQYARRKVTPRLASASIFGVSDWACPRRTPTQSFKSSIETMRTLGPAARRRWQAVPLATAAPSPATRIHSRRESTSRV